MPSQDQIHAQKRPPKGLDRAGKRLWKSVVAVYNLRPDEFFVLETAARCADLVERLETAMVGEPLVTKGSMGQEREHPLLSEQRQQRAQMTRALAQLKLPDLAEGAVPNQQRAAVQSRWSQHRRAGGA